ncbi:permease-like cell division protein FtsX [Mesobacillus maritimus]|uniref:permease-like cell division protein FtsX n=1 Tax=Mesobacillus maritimus TaxID=1643336 RepID=UPI00203CE840|nr:permease-like cell division protein FtsX [Mesobacillus maritimus]MCM3585171.1 permease-like cell division protein FtsX [Mesobacillus maritimus]MCM3668063.1 permease-like cell division protein FtsX [Mesobacillus maritimus]
MKARTFRRHVKESFKSLGRNSWMTVASVSSVTVTLLLVGVFFVIMMNLNSVATSIEEDVEIRVHIDVAANDEDREVLKQQIGGITQVDSIEFSPKEEELDSLIDSFGEEGQAFKLVEQENPLKDVFVVKTKNPTDTINVAKKIESFNYVSSVKYGQGTVESLFKFIDISRNVGLILIIGLLFTAMFLISNTIKITIMARRREIEIMRLVGATNSFIRWPFFLEGLWLGILGSIIPITVVSLAYYYLFDLIQSKLAANNFIKLLEFNPFVFQLSAVLVLIGALIGIWGSLMSVRKFLKV